MLTSSPRADVLVSVVAPTRNAAPYIEAFLRDATAILQPRYRDYEIVVVDNVSTDDTVPRIESLQSNLKNVQLYCLEHRVDRDMAYVVGLEQAIGDVIITLDPGADPVSLIPSLIERFEEGGVDVVYGLRGDRRGGFSRGGIYDLAARVFYVAYRLVTGQRLPEAASTLRLYSRRSVNSFLDNRDRYDLFSVLATVSGFAYRELTYDRVLKVGAPGRPTLGEGILKATRLLLLSSQQPLRVLSLASLAGALLNLAYSGYVVLVNIFKEKVAEGWTSLSLQNSMMFFMLFVILAALCEYTVRLFMHRQERAPYSIIREKRSLVLTRKQLLNVQLGDQKRDGDAFRTET